MSALQTSFALTTDPTAELTLAYIQKLERQKYRAVALLLFLVTVSFIWLLFQFENGPGQDGPALFSNSLYTLTSLIGAFWTFRAAYQASRGPIVLGRRHRLAWILIGLGLLANGLGNIYYGYYQYIFKVETPEPSYADIGFTALYIFMLAGLLLLPVQLKNERLGIHVVIDSLITILCLLGISWFLVIHPAIMNAEPGQLLATIVSISYPCWDILLLMALMLFVHQRAAPVLRPSLLICSLGVLAQVWADSGYSYLTSYGQYQSGNAAIDPFWFLGYLLIGLAPLYQYSAIVRKAYANQAQVTRRVKRMALIPNLNTERHFVLVQSLMIYLPTTVLLGLTLYGQFLPDKERDLTLFLDVLSVVVLFLVMTHYVLATYENARLVHEKEVSRADAELLRKATASLSSVLEMDLLLSHVVTVGATELGFDAAALVLIEEYDRALDEQSSLLARAATSDADPVLAWHVGGQYLPFCLALMGKEIEILWSEAPAHVPTPVHQWHMDQHIQASLFVPLVYQGRIHGSLAFSLRSARHFTERECYLARAFAEEAANAIEHAHLYELARENALFAEAMSNVAARLNSVVATGMGLGSEILHLICTEAANALSADLAILYVQQPDGQFVPQAALSSDPDMPTVPREWTSLSPDDYDVLVPSSPLPTLLQVNQLHLPGRAPEHNAAGRGALVPFQHSPVLAQTSFSPTSSLRPARASLVSLRKYAQPHPGHLFTLQGALKYRHVSTAILAPLIIHQTPVGLLVLARTHKPGFQRKRAFAATDLEPARDFAGQAAIAFTNARLYQQLHNAHRRLQELDQLKDQFMVTASHELRTPLTAVQGYLELLENYHTTLPPEQLEEFLDKASRGCEELVLLLNNVMDASRLEIEAGIRPANLERVSLREVVEHVVDLILLQATQEHRDIRVAVPSQLAVRADPTRLRQVIRNLSVNALKYSPPGTPVLFSARATFNSSPAVILSVSDRGKGIAPQDQGKLFQRFVRLESDLNSTVRGSGLGLYISRRLVEAMNGKIWIESTGTPGEGSTFCVQLPMA
jgi:signal transduction histidine kinase